MALVTVLTLGAAFAQETGGAETGGAETGGSETGGMTMSGDMGYSDFDADANADISETEFGEGVFGRVDANADGTITEDEFTTNECLFQNYQTEGESNGG